METIKYIEDRPHVHVGSRTFIPPDKMQHLESELNYTLISLIDAQKILSSTTLKKIEGRLRPFKNFVRVNRNTIVNLDCIKQQEKNGFRLPDERLLIFSRRIGKTWKKKNE